MSKYRNYSDAFAKKFRDELFYCYLDARKNKRKTRDEHSFEVFDIENLEILADSILNEVYEPGAGIAFVTTYPVVREIFAAPFRDRIVHHYLYNHQAPWWDPRLIYDSYSCRPGKGTLFGIRRVAGMAAKVSKNYEEPAYSVQTDFSGFFMNLIRTKLLERVDWGLKRQYDEGSEIYRMTKYLWGKVLLDDPTTKASLHGNLKLWDLVPAEKRLSCQPPGRGIVIGNLSSQLVSNIYLDMFDRFMKFQLGIKYYGRYVDDAILFLRKDELNEFLEVKMPMLEDFVTGLGLKLHPGKFKVREVRSGFKFLGATALPGRILLDKRSVERMGKIIEDFAIDKATLEQMTSVLGMAKNYNDIKVLEELFRKVGWEYLP